MYKNKKHLFCRLFVVFHFIETTKKMNDTNYRMQPWDIIAKKKTPSPPFVLLPKYLMQCDVCGQQVKDHRHHHHQQQWSIPNSFIHSSIHLSINLSEENYADSLKYFIIVVVIEFILEIDLTKNNQIDSETTKTSPSSSSPAVLV